MKRAAAAAAAMILLAMAPIPMALACNNVPSMDIDAACLKATTSQQLYQLCRYTLRHADVATGDVTGYAAAAAQLAKLSYDSALGTIDGLLAGKPLPGGEKAAYQRCRARYADARKILSGVFGAGLRREYVDATAEVAACAAALAAFRSSPLYSVNAADRDRALLASQLGALVVGR
ncbi:hypothetical protein BRADI_2g32981v3 [Brachypodium distachyon]|uniref:Pectinesterase inhibitor domain-containing protein n=1 Tax=Brachypodium distachyon TaxID=15368 RepID=A0A0Q3G6U9_BRADI|nr:hypothetical protein BRADI_2g32981v3 [Brachypodium distachyon]